MQIEVLAVPSESSAGLFTLNAAYAISLITPQRVSYDLRIYREQTGDLVYETRGIEKPEYVLLPRARARRELLAPKPWASSVVPTPVTLYAQLRLVD